MCAVLTLNEYAFRVLWLEHMRLSEYISEYEKRKHFPIQVKFKECGPVPGSAAQEAKMAKEHPMEKLARELCGVEVRQLTLAKGLKLKLNRIGYAEEGLRLTLYTGMPFEYSTELKLSRGDAEWLLGKLQIALADPANDNLPR